MDKKKKIKPVLAVCFVLLCGVGYLGMRHAVWEGRQIVLEKKPEGSEQLPETGDGAIKVTQTAENRTEDAELSSTEASDKQVLVHVCGAVVNEGVYTLRSGSRVADGITAAGGFTADADTVYHNLAAILSDGQKVYVPTVEETKELSVTDRTSFVNGGDNSTPLLGKNGVGKVNLNTAGVEELMTLSGIGEAKANSILQYREKVGPFQSIEELKNVSGIGDAMFERVRDSIIVK